MPENYIKHLFITPHLADRAVELFVDGEGECRAEIEGEEYVFPAGQPAVLELHGEIREWTPERPELYDLTLTLGEDRVRSYFAMRSFGVGTDSAGVKRLLLNGRPYFHNGVLDQGWWPDGLYTAPSDEALAFDISAAKAMGFNMLRKHVKVEPARWYYHCDRLGMLVWQDMPNGGGKYNALTVSAPPAHGRAHARRQIRPLRPQERARPPRVHRRAAGDGHRALQLPLHRHVGALQRGLGASSTRRRTSGPSSPSTTRAPSTTPAAGTTRASAR